MAKNTKQNIYKKVVALHKEVLDYMTDNGKDHGFLNLATKLMQAVNADTQSGYHLQPDGRQEIINRPEGVARPGTIVSMAQGNPVKDEPKHTAPEYMGLSLEDLSALNNAKLRVIASLEDIETDDLSSDNLAKLIYEKINEPDDNGEGADAGN